MDVPARRETDANVDLEEPTSIVTSHETRPGRVVFTERGNCDGWIATTLTTNVEP